MSDDPFTRALWGTDDPVGSPDPLNPTDVISLALIAAAKRASESSASRAPLISDQLSEAGTALVVDDMNGLHALTRRGRYTARVDVPGALPAMVIETFTPIGGASLPRVGVRTKLSRYVNAYSASADLVAAFCAGDIDAAFIGGTARLALRPEGDRLTVVEVDANRVEQGHALALTAARIARALVDSGAQFAEKKEQQRPAAERVQALLSRVTEAVAWVSGPAERVGDGVEARLALDELPDAPSILRFDIGGQGTCALYFQGPLVEMNERVARLRPQAGALDAMRGLFDTKIDDADFDAAWIIEGDKQLAQKLAKERLLLLRLRARDARLELGPSGLVVRAEGVLDDDVSVVDVVGATLTLWRNLCRAARGLQE